MKLIDIIDHTPIPYAYRIAFLNNFLREPRLRQMERQFGITRPELTVLMCLRFRDGLNSRDICEITEQPSNTVSRGVAALAGKQMIRIEPDPDDARRTLLFLTPEGRSMHDDIMSIFVEAEQRMLACLDETERRQLDHLLDKLARHVPNWFDGRRSSAAASPRSSQARRPARTGNTDAPARSGADSR